MQLYQAAKRQLDRNDQLERRHADADDNDYAMSKGNTKFASSPHCHARPPQRLMMS
jgi:hypothetical protein